MSESGRFGFAFDVTGDCRVRLDDFAMFAGTWLNCGLYPQNGALNRSLAECANEA